MAKKKSDMKHEKMESKKDMTMEAMNKFKKAMGKVGMPKKC